MFSIAPIYPSLLLILDHTDSFIHVTEYRIFILTILTIPISISPMLANISISDSPDEMVGFVSMPMRGTIDILYACLPVLISCIWTSLHLDITREPQTAVKRFWRKLGWALLTIISPERILVQAVQEFLESQRAMNRVNAFFETELRDEVAEAEMWTMVDGFYSEMRGYRYEGKDVTSTRIVQLMQIKRIPPVRSHTREIQDRSKVDSFTKLFVCTQASWLAIQCIARKAEGLPTSLLELGTIGYVLISLAIYAFWWYKPKDVVTYINIDALRSSSSGSEENSPGAQRVANIRAAGSEETKHEVDEEARGLITDPPHRSPSRRRKSSSIITFIQEHEDGIIGIFIMTGCALYGGFHCLAWTFGFPTAAEKWLWRVCAVVTSLPIMWLFVWLEVEGFDQMTGWWAPVAVGTYCLYFASRAIIVVEMFISLRRMRAGVFHIVQWSYFIPHF